MKFALDAEQRQFADSLHQLLSNADVPTVARGWADDDTAPGLGLWKQLAELGVTALAVPDRWGGLGAHPADLVVAFEQLGRHAVPGPLVESIAAVPTLLTELGQHDQLPALAEGELLAGLVAPPHVPLALDADVVDVLFAVNPGDGAVGVAEGTVEGPLRSLDPTRRLFRPGPVRPLTTGASTSVARAFDFGVLACAAQLVGAGTGLLDTAVGYAGGREQFGQPIGSFQSIAHQLADVHVGLELARPLLHGAAVALGARSRTASRDVSAAKVAAGRAAHRAARTALQVHGAIGYTREHPLFLALTKVRALVGSWGTATMHRARVREGLT